MAKDAPTPTMNTFNDLPSYTLSSWDQLYDHLAQIAEIGAALH
jgi:hypothetical protein